MTDIFLYNVKYLECYEGRQINDNIEKQSNYIINGIIRKLGFIKEIYLYFI